MFKRLWSLFAGRENQPVRENPSPGGAGFGRLSTPRGGLHAAVTGGDLAAVQDLIARGADLEERTGDGWTPLIEAVREDMAIITALLDAGANVNASSMYGYTALQRAAGQGRPDVVRLLLSRGADATAVDDAGKSALDFAEERGCRDCVDLLTQAGAPRRSAAAPRNDAANLEAEFAQFSKMLGMAHNVAGAGVASGAVKISGGDGSSTANAVVIRAPALAMGVAAEYEYLRGRFGPRQPTKKGDSAADPPAVGWKMLKVACMTESGKYFDRMEILAAGGTALTVYFDITDFCSGNPLPVLMAHAMSDNEPEQ